VGGSGLPAINRTQTSFFAEYSFYTMKVWKLGRNQIYCFYAYELRVVCKARNYVVSYIAYPVQTTFQHRQNSSYPMVVPMEGHVRQNAASLALLLGGTHTLMAVRSNWLRNTDVRNIRPSPKGRSLVTCTSAGQQLCVCSRDFKLLYNRL